MAEFTDVSFEHVVSLMGLLQGRSAQVGDGDATARAQWYQEDNTTFTPIQRLVEQMSLIGRNLGQVHFTSENQAVIIKLKWSFTIKLHGETLKRWKG